MPEKFVLTFWQAMNELLGLNHTSKLLFLVSLLFLKFVTEVAATWLRASETGH